MKLKKMQAVSSGDDLEEIGGSDYERKIRERMITNISDEFHVIESPMDNSEIEELRKIIVVGDIGIGKTTLIKRYTDNYTSSKSYKPTIGCDFFSKKKEINGKKWNFQFWDVAGNERARSMNGCFYRGANCAILVIDISCRGDWFPLLNSALVWKNDIQNKVPDIPIYLVYNKMDLIEFPDTQLMDIIIQNTKKNFFDGQFFTSCKLGDSVEKCIDEISLELTKKEVYRELKKGCNRFQLDEIEEPLYEEGGEKTCCMIM